MANGLDTRILGLTTEPPVSTAYAHENIDNLISQLSDAGSITAADPLWNKYTQMKESLGDWVVKMFPPSPGVEPGTPRYERAQENIRSIPEFFLPQEKWELPFLMPVFGGLKKAKGVGKSLVPAKRSGKALEKVTPDIKKFVEGMLWSGGEGKEFKDVAQKVFKSTSGESMFRKFGEVTGEFKAFEYGGLGESLLFKNLNRGIPPRDVQNTFWKEVYPHLDKELQEHFDFFIRSLSGKKYNAKRAEHLDEISQNFPTFDYDPKGHEYESWISEAYGASGGEIPHHNYVATMTMLNDLFLGSKLKKLPGK